MHFLESNEIEEWCERHGVTHRSEPYLAALRSAERFMRDAWAQHAVALDHEGGRAVSRAANLTEA